MTHKLYNSKNKDIKYVLYSDKPLAQAISDKDFIVFQFVKTEDSWKSLDLPIKKESFLELINNKEVKRDIKIDLYRKDRKNIRKEYSELIENMDYLNTTSLIMDYCTILEKYPKSLVKEEIGRYFSKNKCWVKLLEFEKLLIEANRLCGSISYVSSPEIAYGSWILEDNVTMDKKSWDTFKYFRELVV